MFMVNATRQPIIKRFKPWTQQWFSGQSNFVKPVFFNAGKFQHKTAIYDGTGSYSFGNIFAEAGNLASNISRQLKGKTGERVLFLCPNDASYVITIWAIWMSGHIAVPLSPLHPEPLLQYYIDDTNSNLMISSPAYQDNMDKLSKKANVKLHVLDEALLKKSKSKTVIEDEMLHDALAADFYQNLDAMILYTSGTTGKPKGVVLTHKNIAIQVQTLITAWKWSHNDVMLHTLPLHHVHGTINALFCPLFQGATTIMLPKFNASEIWTYLLNTNPKVEAKVSVFMAVPTIYSKLVEEFERASFSHDGEKVRDFLGANVRLMVSGSAPLPGPLYARWLDISGHKLLERYGMTEIGMCLSNPYDSDREPGYVGMPLPSVSVALADEETGEILFKCSNTNGELVREYLKRPEEDITGELLVKGDSVFREYYNKPAETAKEFTEDGWFKTGDISQYVATANKIKMLGRKSADIIKTGGYKVSALQIETLLLSHPQIKECAVLGLPDAVYGEKIAAVIVWKSDKPTGLKDLKLWAGDKMPKYWIPAVLKTVDDIPKNAMGKVNKKELRNVFA